MKRIIPHILLLLILFITSCSSESNTVTGAENENKLKEYLYTDDFLKLVSKVVIDDIWDKFKKEDPVWFSHPLSMLLTLSLSINNSTK